jgi:hypothetical protein
MRLLRAIALRVGLVWAVLAVGDPAAAQSLTASTQSGRMTVLAIDYDAGRIVCLSSEGQITTTRWTARRWWSPRRRAGPT